MLLKLIELSNSVMTRKGELKMRRKLRKLLKTNIEKMSTFRLSIMLMKTHELNRSLNDVDENKWLNEKGHIPGVGCWWSVSRIIVLVAPPYRVRPEWSRSGVTCRTKQVAEKAVGTAMIRALPVQYHPVARRRGGYSRRGVYPQPLKFGASTSADQGNEMCRHDIV
jgi:hypothetical protein